MRKNHFYTLLLSATLTAISASAQLATNPDKFLGNITTSGQVNYNGFEFNSLWNQITPENESKWSSVQGNRSKFDWGGCDNCVNYARSHNFPFKFHCLIWGAQYPDWINSLNFYDRKVAVINWMDEIKKHYSRLDMIYVVNEAIAGHPPNTPVFIQALGGEGMTGYDWIVKAFEMAHERWPESILIYNDFNTFQYNTDQFIDLVTKLRDAGAPIDAYGCQSHDLTDCNITTFKNSMAKLQNSIKMPMYISEYDLGTYDDNQQKTQMQNQFPLMWEADYCAGVTLWGFIYGHTWTENGNSGLIKDGKDRPAMTWLREYMASDKAKNVKSPFPNMKKEISLYIKPAKYKSPVGEPCDITVSATMHNGKAIEKVELYVNDKLATTMTAAPYVYQYTPENEKKVNLKAIVYTSDGKTFERLGGFYGSKYPQHPYTATGEPKEIPGIVEAEDFDMGGEGISYHTSRTSESTIYRDDQGKVGIFANTDAGQCIDQPNDGDWLDYTIKVTKAGKLNYEAVVGTMQKDSEVGFTMFLYKNGDLKRQTDVIVPYTGRRKFTSVKGDISYRFSAGEYKIRVLFNKGKVSIDKIYIGTTSEAEGIEDINNQNDQLYSVFSVAGTYVGKIEAADYTETVQQIRRLTNVPGVYVIKNLTNNKSKTIMMR